MTDMSQLASSLKASINSLPQLSFAITTLDSRFLTLSHTTSGSHSPFPSNHQSHPSSQPSTSITLNSLVQGFLYYLEEKTPWQGHIVDICYKESLTEWSRKYVVDISSSSATLHQTVEKYQLMLRKNEHIHICSSLDVEHSQKHHGFDDYRFVPTTLSDMADEDIDCSVTFLNKKFSCPFFVTSMCGGTDLSGEINHRIASICSHLQIPMGVGSQRIALDNPKCAKTFQVKKTYPKLFLMANLGISAFTSPQALNHAQKAIDMIDADALCIHGNILQELIQTEGQRHFKGLWHYLETCATHIQQPLIFKEVGCGIDVTTAKRLQNCGIQALDVGGAGGTSWGYIEGIRSQQTSHTELGKHFRNWGIPTAESLHILASSPDIHIPLTATGGIRNGITAAKACHLGASMVGLGLPILQAVMKDIQQPHNAFSHLKTTLNTLIKGFRIVQHLTNSASIDDLKRDGILHHTSKPTP
ncbi:MAG: type 2 isopentenyl-diphosphate Delta-isomerase [Proteobacteria bacterium]|nr:type 2 isopentenyl-diphosphate Delta-isomerase [Pseudomonadota bacterium]